MAKEHMAHGFLSGLKKGALHKQMGIAQGKPISTGALEAEKPNASPLEAKRIQFAENARKWSHS